MLVQNPSPMKVSFVSSPLRSCSRLLQALIKQFPSRCPLCQMRGLGGLLCAGCEADTFAVRQARALCATCAADLPDHGKCDVCTSDTPLNALVCAMDYQFPGQLLIQLYKEGNQLALARVLADSMVRAAGPLLDEQPPDIWVPIPASLARLQRNGFSPAAQLARAVAGLTGVPCRLDGLVQVRASAPQKTLNRAERALAVKGRLKAGSIVRGLRVGVIDDVVTTTSTVTEAARVLKAAGAREVIVLAAARTPLRA